MTAILAATTLNPAINEARLDTFIPVIAAPVLLLLDETEPVLCEEPVLELVREPEPEPEPELDAPGDATAVPLPIVMGVYCTPFKLAATSNTLPSFMSYYGKNKKSTPIPSAM